MTKCHGELKSGCRDCEIFHNLFGRAEVLLSEYLPILVYLFAVVLVTAFSIIAPHLIAPRKPTRVKDMPYESGMDPVGDVRAPLEVKFYLIAILFLVFDVELVFLYPWAVALQGEDGIPGGLRLLVLGVLLLLVATLGVAYAVAWRKGVFQWRRH